MAVGMTPVEERETSTAALEQKAFLEAGRIQAMLFSFRRTDASFWYCKNSIRPRSTLYSQGNCKTLTSSILMKSTQAQSAKIGDALQNLAAGIKKMLERCKSVLFVCYYFQYLSFDLQLSGRAPWFNPQH